MTDINDQRTAEILDRIHRDLYSLDPSRPGLLLRQDRIERQIASALKILTWLVSGGLLQFLATLVLLYQVLQNLPEAP